MCAVGSAPLTFLSHCTRAPFTPLAPSSRQTAQESLSCRDFHHSVLASLPHRWEGPWDSTLTAAHFERQMAGKGAQRAQLAKGRSLRPPSPAGQKEPASKRGATSAIHKARTCLKRATKSLCVFSHLASNRAFLPRLLADRQGRQLQRGSFSLAERRLQRPGGASRCV